MGQYFKLVNLTKREFVRPWDIDGGAKLWEWTANLNQCGVILSLINGRWKESRIVLVGDYDSSKLYDTVSEEYKNVSSIAKKLFNSTETQKLIKSKKKLYLINKNKNQYIAGSFKQLSICLPLVLRQSDSRGGGDIYEDYGTAGIWVDCSLSLSLKEPSSLYLNMTSEIYKDAFDFYKH